MKRFIYCLIETNFSIDLEIRQCKKLVEHYKTNLISSGSRNLKLPASSKNRSSLLKPMKIKMKRFIYCSSKINFSIDLEIRQCEKLVERYKTNLISSGSRNLKLPASIFNVLY
ncbi:MAG: hypothetical protein PHW92_09560 [Lutibacter sp.]|nr:hypothetical protein [Lutibacter sp.]